MRGRDRLAGLAILALGAALVGGRPALADDAAAGKPVYDEKGEASWYGDGLKGKKTASGERFDPAKPTAAHPELPLGSKATVTNLENGRKVEVEITDRGPGDPDRVIDVSKGAAKKLDMTKDGTAEVKVEATVKQVKEADKPEAAEKLLRKKGADVAAE